MGTQNELVQRLEDGYNKFSKGQKKLADFIREDYDKAAFMRLQKWVKRLESVNRQL